jgi:two-component system sensor histidine kinase DctS
MPYWLEDRIEETLARHDTLRKGGLKTQRFETRFCRKDGTELDVQVFEAPLIDANGGHRGWMGSIIDITDQTRAAEITRMQAESLQRTGRLVTLGEMASSLAHELNQPLAAIASYAAGSLNLLRDGEQSSDVIIPAIEKVAAQAARAGQIIRRIQDFVRKRDPKFVEIDLATVVGDTAAFLAADARNHDAVIDVEAEAGLAPVRADRILIEQVLINLMRNGIEAMQGNGDGARKLAIRLWSSEGRQIIDIRDHGSGIAESVAGRIFEPFVTSKADGMGMGLNICRTIVELHHGHLVFRAHPEGGTVFSIELPGPTRVEVAAE